MADSAVLVGGLGRWWPQSSHAIRTYVFLCLWPTVRVWLSMVACGWPEGSAHPLEPGAAVGRSDSIRSSLAESIRSAWPAPCATICRSAATGAARRNSPEHRGVDRGVAEVWAEA